MSMRLAFLLSLTALAACGGSSAGPALRAKADSLLTSGRGQVTLYAKTGDGRVIQVADPTIPQDSTTETSYAVLKDSTGTVVLLIETPVSKSGDWTNEYRHYFDAEGRTAFFRRYSSFFEGCEFGLAKEVLERSYTTSFKTKLDTYSLTNPEGSPQDSTRCEFRYHFPYEVYPTWEAAATALKIPRS